MNTLILNRETFSLPTDHWYQIAPLGEFPHSPSGTVQVIDAAACTSMVNRFNEESRVENFAGLLIDFDHFSLDQGSKSEAAGWIVALEARPSGQWAVGRMESAMPRATAGAKDCGRRFVGVIWARML